jgi:hypothetical protein
MTIVIYADASRGTATQDMELKMSASSPVQTFSPARIDDTSETKKITWSRPIRRGAFALAAALAAAACTGGAGLDILEPVHSETGNYCVDEAQGLLQKRFGPNARITQAKEVNTYSLWELWVRSNVCTDWIVFYPPGLISNPGCTMPAYGSAPISLAQMWGHGDCADLPAEGDHANLPVEGDRATLPVEGDRH